MAGAPSAPFSGTSTVGGPGTAGVGPVLLRTVRPGADVSERFLVMLAGVVGGESLGRGGGGGGGVCVTESSVVCQRDSCGRAAALWEFVAREGEAGGVWVDARGRVLGGLPSRGPGSSEVPACKWARR